MKQFGLIVSVVTDCDGDKPVIHGHAAGCPIWQDLDGKWVTPSGSKFPNPEIAAIVSLCVLHPVTRKELRDAILKATGE